ncbi:MAG: Fic family protein [Ottowia sp.]|nr:Fic family protein [Ottowia sp.]
MRYTMREQDAWQFELDAYIREGEPGRAQRAANWQTAIGLQAVDGLQISSYLLETAKAHIEGFIGVAEAQQRIDDYYKAARASRKNVEGFEEADTVSSRMAELLGERAFTFSPAQLQAIHRRLFARVLSGAGEYRTCNITKKEWVLKGDTVYYASHDSIADTLEYDFAQERKFDYRGLRKREAVQHIAAFIAGIWQIHPFSEGNTRTTAVFAIKYLSSFGYTADNTPVKQHSWYFRNALVRANYENLAKGIHRERRFLDRFFENLLLGTQHELKNQHILIDWHHAAHHPTQETPPQATLSTRDRILALLQSHPEATARQLAQTLGITFDGVRYHLAQLRKAGILRREGATKGGRWVVSVRH